MRLTVKVEEGTWRRLRRLAEDRRVVGRASVAAVIASIIETALAEMDAWTAANVADLFKGRDGRRLGWEGAFARARRRVLGRDRQVEQGDRRGINQADRSRDARVAFNSRRSSSTTRFSTAITSAGAPASDAPSNLAQATAAW